MKNFINRILDVPKLIRTIWFMLWIILVILLILKFCFNQWYPVISNNQTFNNICDYIDNHKWLNITILLIIYTFACNILFLTNVGNKKYSKWYFLIISNIVIIGIFGLKYISNVLGLLIEILVFVVFAIIYNLKTNKFYTKVINILLPIISYALMNLWQFTMLIVRGTDDLILSNLPMLIILILQFDYYIFLTITWIGVSFMGLAGPGWFWCKDVTVLKAAKEKELARKKPNMDTIAKIDERIAELEKEGK